jgi:3-phosphoshikimate 1-carboxyvinyltransferase
MQTLTLNLPQHPINATIPVSGSKSYTNRALLLAALAPGRSVLHSVSPSSDSDAMVAALDKLGIRCEPIEAGVSTSIAISGRGGEFTPYRGVIDVGPAGTTMRFLTSVCAAIPGADITLRGTARMHQRPIQPLVDALRTMGASIEYLENEGCPPLRIHSQHPLTGGVIAIDGSVSSQFISSLLLASSLCQSPLTIEIVGEQTSKSYIDMTLQSLADFGITVANEGYARYVVQPNSTPRAQEYRIEGDASGASYLWGLAALSGGSVTVENINPDSAQGDIAFPALLEEMGCSVSRGERSITVTGSKTLRGIRADMVNMPDTAQSLAVIAACAHGSTTITGLATLRIKETDRIAAMQTELAKFGVRCDAGPDYLVVHGVGDSPLPADVRVATYEDHRMAMSLAMLGVRSPRLQIEEPDVVKKSFPDFWTVLEGC